MTLETLVLVVSRWVHVGTAIVLVGGAVFQRFVLLPAARALSDEDHQQLRERVMMRWKKFVMAGILLLGATGLYNYIARIQEHPVEPRYHMFMGIKILLALGVFFIASALTGRSAGLAAIRRDAPKWQGVLIGLAFLVVAIAGYLKIAPPTAP